MQQTVLINFDYTNDEKYSFIRGFVSRKIRNNTGKALTQLNIN